jgi:cell division ATPase FtsA
MIRLPFRFKSSKIPSKFLTVDIGSDAVKVMSFDLGSRDECPIAVISGVGKTDLNEESTRGGVIVDVESVGQALESAILSAYNGDGAVKDIVFGVSGTLSVGIMTTVKVVRGKNEPVSSKEVDGIFERLHSAAYDEIQTSYLNITGDPEIELTMITSSVVYSKMDGEIMDDIVGKSGQVVEVAVFTAFTPTYHLDILQGLAESLGLNIVAIGSNMYSLVKSLSGSKGKDFDGVILDVGGELTDVGVVFGGGIVSTRSIDIGGTHFTKEIGKHMNLSFMDAEAKKLEYSYGRLQESDEILLKGYIDNLLDTWLTGLELLFQDFTGVKTFAPQIFMVGGGAEFPDIFDVVSKEPWTKSIPFKSPPEFSKLTIEDLDYVSDKTGKGGSLENLIPAALSIIFLEAKGLID